MRYVAAYLLATLGGNNNPSANDIKGILEAVGIEADQERLDRVIKELSGKDINEVIMCQFVLGISDVLTVGSVAIVFWENAMETKACS